MTEPASSAAGGWAIGKAVGAVLGVGFVASVLGFMVLWPKTMHEAIVRMAATVVGCFTLGPVMCVAMYWKYPEMFSAGMKLATEVGIAQEAAPLAGVFMVATPIILMSGMPFWWLLGAMMLWFENRRGQDIGQLAADVRSDVGKVISP